MRSRPTDWPRYMLDNHAANRGPLSAPADARLDPDTAAAPGHAPLEGFLVPRIIAISPPCTGPWIDALVDLHGSGVDAIILRLLETPGDLPGALAAARQAGLRVLVRPVLPGDADAAIAEGAGLHLPDHGPPARRGAALMSTSCHDAGRVVQAADARLDFCTLAPVFSPGSKPGDTRPVLGLAGLRAVTRQAPGFPILALGGIQPDTVSAILEAGAHGVAGITGFFHGLHVDASGAAAIARAVSRHTGASPGG